ncbi:hypothetical protein Nepgr_032520 [Nepenthes gracilis]|uniref:Uncharacterized protein n=1 Tax=Nepenthes gracilis TaxID=150966 RepID=A0AAD3TL04_NEPGR|nr:hypothetical protein Nepgr_032520 [Nepenthes gracilis]
MSCMQVASFRPHVKVKTLCSLHGLLSWPRVSVLHAHQLPRTFPRLTTNRGKFHSKAKSEGNNQEPIWKSFEKALGSFGKKQSAEDLLRQQMEKQEYYDDGGSGVRPPFGGGGGGSGDEDPSGTWDEVVQVVLATIGFIFLYIYIINGQELTRLAKDYIRYLFGAKKSIRLTRAMEEWESFFRSLTQKPEVDPHWLEREIVSTTTWWDSPQKYRAILDSYLESKGSQNE